MDNVLTSYRDGKHSTSDMPSTTRLSLIYRSAIYSIVDVAANYFWFAWQLAIYRLVWVCWESNCEIEIAAVRFKNYWHLVSRKLQVSAAFTSFWWFFYNWCHWMSHCVCAPIKIEKQTKVALQIFSKQFKHVYSFSFEKYWDAIWIRIWLANCNMLPGVKLLINFLHLRPGSGSVQWII